MNERHLRYLQTIAAEGSIHRASRILEKNPSTLTRVVKNMEESMGIPLFLRTAGGLVLTPAGRQAVRLGEEILRLSDDLERWRSSRCGGLGRRHEWTQKELQYLSVIREQKNISRAAGELYLAQPSLSQMLMELETDMGEAIFIRSKEGVTETAFGTELLDRLGEIREWYRRLEAELDDFRQMKKGTLTIGIPLNLGTSLLPKLLPEFSSRYPGIQIQIRENNTSELERLLIAKKIDFCIMHDCGNQEMVEYEVFADDPFYLVIPAGQKERYGLPKDRPLTAEDLKRLSDAPFIMVASRQKLRLVADKILAAAGISPRICCTTKSMETAKRLAACGMGATFLPGAYLTLYSGVEGLESYPIDESLNGSWKLTAAYLKDGLLSRSAREFLRMMKESMGGTGQKSNMQS